MDPLEEKILEFVEKAKAAAMGEKDFLEQVIDLGHLYHWRIAHFRPSVNQRGQWSTAVQADGAGFPDLIMVREDRLLFAELKSEKGKVSDSQYEWIDALKETNAEVYIWKPSDFDKIAEVLSRPSH